MYCTRPLLALASSLLLGSSLASAGDLFAYAPSGRTDAQQQQDRYECHQWAVEQTKFDPVQLAAQSTPAVAPPTNSSTATSSNGNRAPSPVITGAAQGALLSEASKGEADRGAAVGAGAGLLRGRMAQRKAEEQKAAAQQQSQQQQRNTDAAQLHARQQEYQRARGTCFRARGYTVSEG